MKKNTALITIALVASVTVAMTFIQPTVIHQLVVWVSGLFGLVMTVAVFVVSNWRAPATVDNTSEDTAIIQLIKYLRSRGMPDGAISANIGVDIDVIKAIPR